MKTDEIRAKLKEKNIDSRGSKSEIKNRLQEINNNLFSNSTELINNNIEM
jgi:hypothetical protein